MNQKDLKKALDKFRDVLLDNDACDHILSEYDGFHDLFSVFQKDNMVVPRKQLEDLDKGFPSINSRKYYENGTVDYIKWATDVIRWRGKFQDFRFGLLEKELLEATQK